MKIKLNSNQEIVNTIQEGLKRTGGYCPCRVERTPENKCMCQEFINQQELGINDFIIPETSEVSNRKLTVENMVVDAGTASRFCIGGIAGSLGAGMTIENSYVKGMTVVAAPSGTDKTTYVGGIAGRTLGNSGVIKNVYTAMLLIKNMQKQKN